MNDCKGKEFECPLATMLENLPNNRPFYKEADLSFIKIEFDDTNKTNKSSN